MWYFLNMEKVGVHPKHDFENIDFGDKRLNKRLQKSIEDLTKNSQKSILGAGNGRSSAKGFYRLLGNDKFDIEKMADAASEATINRMGDTVLLIEDTTDINLNGHKKTKDLGYSSEHVLGIKVHSCIALTPEGLPLGLVRQYYNTRCEAENNDEKNRSPSRPIEEKESYRWLKMLDESTEDIPREVNVITICDREGDFYELYAYAQELGEDFIIRVTHDRATESDEKVISQIHRTKAIGEVIVNIPRNSRTNAQAYQAKMEVAYCAVRIKRPSSVADKTLPESLTMNIVRITEIDVAEGREPIEWIIATSLPVNSAEDVMLIVEYYVHRWKIERFHFILKSGCSVEKIQQRTYEKIKPMLLIYSVIAMFIMAITYIGRVLPNTFCDIFFNEDEWKILYQIIHKTKTPPEKPYSMADAVKYLGQLGSYKRAPSDGPPGVKSIWNGLTKLYEFMEMYSGLG